MDEGTNVVLGSDEGDGGGEGVRGVRGVRGGGVEEVVVDERG